jgi:intergrase/recombinase
MKNKGRLNTCQTLKENRDMMSKYSKKYWIDKVAEKGIKRKVLKFLICL